MKEKKSISARAEQASKSMLRVDLGVFAAAIKNLYHEKENPGGTFPLNIAENKLGWALLKDKLTALIRQSDIPPWVAGYTSRRGAPAFREALADFLAKFLTHCPLDPTHIGISSGATGIIELSSWILADHGDVAVFPAPAYSTYKQDIALKAGLQRYDLMIHEEQESRQARVVLEIAHLEKALKDLEGQGQRFRMLVLTNPDNPTGSIYPYETLYAIAEWCIHHQIHLIVNEIYGLSLIDTTHPELQPDYLQVLPFISFANIMQEKQSDYLHLWYSLSKDLGVSGFRVGMVYSLSESFFKAFDNLNSPHLVSNHTQWLFQLLLSDHTFMSKYIERLQVELTDSYLTVIRVLRKLNIPYIPARGSLFVCIDLSKYLSEQSPQGEKELWEDLYRSTGILLTPGAGYGHTKRGQFRLVHSCLPTDHLKVAMERFRAHFT